MSDPARDHEAEALAGMTDEAFVTHEFAGENAGFLEPMEATGTSILPDCLFFLMSQSRPVRSVHRGKGWAPELIAEHAAPALRPSLHALDRSQDVFGWDRV